MIRAFEAEEGMAHFHVVSCPMIVTTIVRDEAFWLDFMVHLEEYDYVAFSRRKAIEAFAEAWKLRGGALPSSVGWCAIGKDNEMLRERLQVEPAFIVAEPSPMGIVKHLEGCPSSRGRRIAVLAPQVVGMAEPPIVPDFIRGLENIGMKPSRFNVYQTQAADGETLDLTARRIQEKVYAAVVFTSGTEIKVFLQMVPKGVSTAEFMK